MIEMRQATPAPRAPASVASNQYPNLVYGIIDLHIDTLQPWAAAVKAFHRISGLLLNCPLVASEISALRIGVVVRLAVRQLCYISSLPFHLQLPPRLCCP